MGTVVKFRRDSEQLSRLSKKKKNKKKNKNEEWGRIVIFPGIRIERHDDTEDYLKDSSVEDHESDTG